jgi:hypothetical protein
LTVAKLEVAMPDDTGEKQRRRDAGAPFQPGQSGNPNGRPAGARNRVSVLAQRLMDADAKPVILALIEAAKGGDVSRVWSLPGRNIGILVPG